MAGWWSVNWFVWHIHIKADYCMWMWMGNSTWYIANVLHRVNSSHLSNINKYLLHKMIFWSNTYWLHLLSRLCHGIEFHKVYFLHCLWVTLKWKRIGVHVNIILWNNVVHYRTKLSQNLFKPGLDNNNSSKCRVTYSLIDILFILRITIMIFNTHICSFWWNKKKSD